MNERTSAASERFAIAERTILGPNDLSPEEIEGALANLMGRGSDFGDLYFESSHSESWSLHEQKVSNGTFSINQGVGARAVRGDQTAFAYSGEMTPRALRTAVQTVGTMQRHGQDMARAGGVKVDVASSSHALYPTLDPIESAGVAEKIALLHDLDQRARAADPRIVSATVAISAGYKVLLVAGSDGVMSADVRPVVQLNVAVIAEQGGKRTSGAASLGGRYSVPEIDDAKRDDVVGRATRIALLQLEARPAPAGVMTVVLGAGVPGILLHEAIGHGLEGDAHRKRSSVFVDRMGAQIAARGVTVIDDGSVPDRLGSLNVDDEGSPTRRTVLIEDGRLTGLMQDRLNARLMNQVTTGNARRQSYAHLPMPRMTNTYLANGTHEPGEIIASVKNGIYATSFGGGTVDITSGQFNFSAIEAYLIEDGRITAPIEGATLIGLGHEALNRVSMVGSDLTLDDGVCGKNGQSVSVGVGQPTVRIDEMVVGGSA